MVHSTGAVVLINCHSIFPTTCDQSPLLVLTTNVRTKKVASDRKYNSDLPTVGKCKSEHIHFFKGRTFPQYLGLISHYVLEMFCSRNNENLSLFVLADRQIP